MYPTTPAGSFPRSPYFSMILRQSPNVLPSGTVGPALYDLIRIVAGLFPFKPALQAIEGALDPAGPSVGPALLHLAALTVAYGLLARLALRRFASV